MRPRTLAALLATCVVMLTLTTATRADEGLWLFNHPPTKLLKEKYNFDPPPGWYDHVQKSSVRFNSGGSGSFVSANGLVMTNHHVGLETLQKLSTREKDYVKDGFYARTQDEEPKALDLELNVLMEIKDVTKEVKAAVGDLTGEKAFEARRAIINKIEDESQKATGLRSNVVTLYQGNQYHLYQLKRYTDVRLVFAPEQQIAFYGGDPDNFEYPRYDLDICFFRAYENGKPARPDHYLKWSQKGTDADDLVFVSGHPGRTSRLLTMAELEYTRDSSLPKTLQRLYRLEVLLDSYSSRSKENARRAKGNLFGVRNSRKAINGKLGGLLDPNVMAKKAADEKKLREAVAGREDLQDARRSWQRIAEAQSVIAANARAYNLLEGGAAFNSELFGIARTLLRAAEERSKPNGERL